MSLNNNEIVELRKKIIENEFARMNDMQKKAVLSVNGQLLILAGAGSGKTTVLVNRIANILRFGEAYESDKLYGDYSEDECSEIISAARGETTISDELAAKLPRFDVPDGKDHIEYFRDECYKGLYRRYGENPDKSLIDRLEYELSVIIKMGYVDYYLIVNDYVSYAKRNGIPVGMGRGSGAGSLAAYCIGITGIDPIKYNLLFERFLNPERVSMPDFDVDFCKDRRQEVIDYVIRKYGSDHVAQIIAFGTMAA